MSLPYADSVTIMQGPVYRRDKKCPEGFQLCPESLRGNCCPNDRSCGVSSCYATTAAPRSVCSKNGYVPCGIEQGGGCCPSGHSCADIGCAPISGTYTSICPTGAYLCPKEVAGFGACCKSGLACGKGFCYSTSYPTQTLVLTSVFRDSNQDLTTTIATITTAIQPSSIPTIATTTGPTRIVVTETAIAKIAAVDTKPTTGMSKGTMDGIIAGAVAALVIIILAAWFIIKRLNRLARMREFPAYTDAGSGHKHNLSGDSGNSNLSRVGGEMRAIDSPRSPMGTSQRNMSTDPLFASGPTTPRLPRPSMSHSTSNETDIYGASPPPIPAPYVWNQGYTHVANNEGSYFTQSQRTPMNSSGGIGTYSPAYGGHASDLSRESYLRDNQNLRFGHDTSMRQSLVSTHGRQWSDASDVSNNSNNNGNAPSELDGRRVSVTSQASETGMSPGSAMRPSGERRTRSWTFIPSGGRKRSGAGLALQTLYGGPSTPLSGGGRLEGVAEAETDASHTTGLLGKAMKKGGRPRASTKGSDMSVTTVRGLQGRSASEGQIPQIMYTHQAENHSLPTVPDSPPTTRAVPHLAGPLTAHPTPHPPLLFSTGDINVAATETSTERTEQHTQGSETTEADYERAKKEVLVQTREINPRDPLLKIETKGGGCQSFRSEIPLVISRACASDFRS